MILIGSTGIVTSSYAEPEISIIMEKTTYTYCERLTYSIEVSEITGSSAIIHIRDAAGGKSSAIPIPIEKLSNPIPSPHPFEKDIFPLGKYFIDVEYLGVETTAEFNLIDSDNMCISEAMQPVVVPIPMGGGGGGQQVTSTGGSPLPPTLSANPSNPIALDLAYRLSAGASFA